MGGNGLLEEKVSSPAGGNGQASVTLTREQREAEFESRLKTEPRFLTFYSYVHGDKKRWEARKEFSGTTIVFRLYQDSLQTPVSGGETWKCVFGEEFFRDDRFKLRIVLVTPVIKTEFVSGKQHTLRFYNNNRGGVIPKWAATERQGEKRIVYVPQWRGKLPTEKMLVWSCKESRVTQATDDGNYQRVIVELLEPLPERPSSKDLRNLKKVSRREEIAKNRTLVHY